MKNQKYYTSTLELLKKHSSQLNKMIEDGSFYCLSYTKRYMHIRQVKRLYNKLRGPIGEKRLVSILAAASILVLGASCAVSTGGGNGPERPDVTPPTVSTLSPADNATDVVLNKDLVINFSEAVVTDVGSIRIYDSGGTLIESIPAASAQVSGSGTSTITINPAVDFSSSTDYYVQIDANAFKDKAGNPYAGIGDDMTWNFQTELDIPPSVVSLSPVDGSTGVSLGANLVINFSEAVVADVGSIRIYDSGGTLIESIPAASAQVSGSGTSMITINPANNFLVLTDYYVQIDADAFKDTTGNFYAGITDTTTWNFRTEIGDITPPSAVSFSPADNATDVVLNKDLVINFSEAVVTDVGSIRIYDSGGTLIESIPAASAQVSGSGTPTITINPAVDFAGLTDYYVQIDVNAFKDTSNNFYPGIANTTTWNFQTEAAAVTPSFAAPVQNPFGLGPTNNFSFPAFADLDGDGDMDLLVGEGAVYPSYDGNFQYFQNIGTANTPNFAAPVQNPFGLTSVFYVGIPTFADLDGDGDIDLLVGDGVGDLVYFANIGTANTPNFAAPVDNPFGLYATTYASPEFADLDGDGDMDLLIGDAYSYFPNANFQYFQNIGTANTPNFAPPVQNPFGLTAVYYNAFPTFADLDGDGDMDLMVGEYYANFQYFENTGTANTPNFAAQVQNPFGLIAPTYTFSAPAFADLDGDGDMDLLSGETSYYNTFADFYYFQNTTP